MANLEDILRDVFAQQLYNSIPPQIRDVEIPITLTLFETAAIESALRYIAKQKGVSLASDIEGKINKQVKAQLDAQDNAKPAPESKL